MGSIRTAESVLAADNTVEARRQNCPSEELPPVTLQVVLRGTDGIVIASDTAVSSQLGVIRYTDSSSKMMVKPRFVCLFSGDDCAKYIAMEIVGKVGDLG